MTFCHVFDPITRLRISSLRVELAAGRDDISLAPLPGSWDGVSPLVLRADGLGWDLVQAEQASQSIEQARAAKRAAIVAARDAAEVAPITVGGRSFDADMKSLFRISVALGLATDPGWIEQWTLADNSVSPVTSADLQAVLSAVATRASGLHGHCRALLAQVQAANSPAELQDITPNWPASG